MCYKAYFPTLQAGRKGTFFHSEVTHLFSIRPVLTTMKLKLSPPLAQSDAEPDL